MNVRSLSDNAGMLFDLRQYPGASMWMKNTYIPLDMLFIGCDWKVVDIYENAKPLSLRRIGSSKPFCYVLEINGGNCNGRRGYARPSDMKQCSIESSFCQNILGLLD